MKVDGTHYCSLWWNDDDGALRIIGQRWLPHDSRVTELNTLEDCAFAMRDMWVRGAPLIGATATCAMALRMAVDPSDEALNRGWDHLHATRPTAINLRWALDRCRGALLPLPARTHAEAALALAHAGRRRGCRDQPPDRRTRPCPDSGETPRKPAGEPVRLLTHCNSGWIATVD